MWSCGRGYGEEFCRIWEHREKKSKKVPSGASGGKVNLREVSFSLWTPERKQDKVEIPP